MDQPSELRVRRDIQSILDDGAAGQPVLAGYASAIQKMRQIDAAEDQQGLPANPLGWRYQAALHGISTGEGVPLTADKLWNSCRHNSWFFFAWHRMYLYRFERILQFHLGDENWSLPYWDYTKGSPASRVLPAPFRVNRPDNALLRVSAEKWSMTASPSGKSCAMPRTLSSSCPSPWRANPRRPASAAESSRTSGRLQMRVVHSRTFPTGRSTELSVD